MKKLFLIILSFSFITSSCADKDEIEGLDKEFWNLVTTLMTGIAQPGASGIAILINQLLNMGFDQDSPGIEMLEGIEHDMQEKPIEKLLEEVDELKLRFIQKMAAAYLKIGYITQKADFSEDTKGILIKDELQELLSDCFPGLRLPQDPEFFDLAEFLQVNKSVKVPDYKARIYALIALIRSRACDEAIINCVNEDIF